MPAPKPPISRDRYVPETQYVEYQWVHYPWTSETRLHNYRREYLARSGHVHNPLNWGVWRSPSAFTYIEHNIDQLFSEGYVVLRDLYGNRTITRGVLNDIAADWSGVDYDTPASLIAQCDIAALNKMRDEAVNIGVALGERRETAKLIGDNALRIVQAVRALRRGRLSDMLRHLGLKQAAQPVSGPRRFRNRREIAQRAPEIWLEYQYGVKPLVGDVYTAIDRFEDNNYRDPTRLYAHVKSALSYRGEGEYVRQVPYGLATYSWQVDHTVKVRLDFSPEEGTAFARLKSAEEWGILNPFAIAWELVPFSFVADWFYPVGDWLSAVSAAVPYRFRSGSRTIFRKASGSAVRHSPSSDPWTSCEANQGIALMDGTFFIRHNLGEFPVPSMAALSSRHHKDASMEAVATRSANAISILATTMSDLERQRRR